MSNYNTQKPFNKSINQSIFDKSVIVTPKNSVINQSINQSIFDKSVIVTETVVCKVVLHCLYSISAGCLHVVRNVVSGGP